VKDKSYVLPPAGAVFMSAEAADRLIAAGDGEAALLYIYILRNNGRFDPSDAGKLPLQGGLAKAMNTLRAMGMVAEGPEVRERPDEPPEYTADEIADHVSGNSQFATLVREVQSRLGRVLSGGDLKILYGLYDYLGLPPEVILLLVVYCTEQTEQKAGPGRKPSMRFIEKEAYVWARNEIVNLDSAEEYIRRIAEKRLDRQKICDCLGIRGRALSPGEEKYIASWVDMGFPPESVEEAYDRTVLKKGALVWPYMNSILKSWHSKGLHTPQEIKAGDGRALTTQAGGGAGDGELARLKRSLDKLKKSGG